MTSIMVRLQYRQRHNHDKKPDQTTEEASPAKEEEDEPSTSSPTVEFEGRRLRRSFRVDAKNYSEDIKLADRKTRKRSSRLLPEPPTVTEPIKDQEEVPDEVKKDDDALPEPEVVPEGRPRKRGRKSKPCKVQQSSNEVDKSPEDAPEIVSLGVEASLKWNELKQRLGFDHHDEVAHYLIDLFHDYTR